VAGPDPSTLIEAGQTFSLRVGETAQTGDGALRIGLEDVGADSRCPKGERCVWAGDATVRIWLQRRGGARERRELHTATGAANGGHAPSPELRLVRLDPVPVTGKVITQRDYVATLALTAER
jgi:hypothetical protein